MTNNQTAPVAPATATAGQNVTMLGSVSFTLRIPPRCDRVWATQLVNTIPNSGMCQTGY